MKRTTMTSALLASLGLAASLIPTQASAVSTLGSCDVNDVTSTVYGAADACYGLAEGNIDTGGTFAYENLIPDSAFGGAFAGDNWMVVGYDQFDDPLDDNFLTGGTWSLNLPGNSELVIILKQATLWGAWYFNPSGTSGTWSTHWDGDGNETADTTGPFAAGTGYSHGIALVREGTVQVPEPGTLGMLGVSLLGVAFAMRRRAVL